MEYHTCVKCWNSYEYYPHGTILPECPVCGSWKKLTHKEYYKAMGVECNCEGEK